MSRAEIEERAAALLDVEGAITANFWPIEAVASKDAWGVIRAHMLCEHGKAFTYEYPGADLSLTRGLREAAADLAAGRGPLAERLGDRGESRLFPRHCEDCRSE